MTLSPEVALAVAAAFPMAIGFALWRYARRRRTVAARLGDRALLTRLSGFDAARPPVRRIGLVLGASAMLAAAIVAGRADLNPTDAASAADLVIVLDVSNSMLVEDVTPNRLEVARALALSAVDERSDARIGVVVFAGEAAVLAPPTRDHTSVRMLLEIASPTFATQTGSAPAAGLRQATALLAGNPGGGTVLLLSDGEPIGDHQQRDAVEEAARRAAALGVVVHGVGTGTRRGGPVPDIDQTSGTRTGWKREPGTGEIAISVLDPQILEALAAPTGGEVFLLSEAGSARAVLDRIRIQDDARAAGTPRFPATYMWFCGIALLLLLMERLFDARVFGRRPAPHGGSPAPRPGETAA